MALSDPLQFALSGEFPANSQSINSIAINHHSNKIITSSDDGKLVIWSSCQSNKKKRKNNFQTNLVNAHLQCDNKPIKNIDIDPNGHFAVTASNDKTIKLWNLQSYKLQQSFNHTKRVLSVSLSPPFIISGLEDSTVIIRNMNGNILHKIQIESISDNIDISNISISPNHKFLIISAINLVNIYKINPFQPHMVELIHSIKHCNNIHKLKISNNNQLFAIACNHKYNYKPSNMVQLHSISNGTIAKFGVDGII
eukprot:92018_1